MPIFQNIGRNKDTSHNSGSGGSHGGGGSSRGGDDSNTKTNGGGSQVQNPQPSKPKGKS